MEIKLMNMTESMRRVNNHKGCVFNTWPFFIVVFLMCCFILK